MDDLNSGVKSQLNDRNERNDRNFRNEYQGSLIPPNGEAFNCKLSTI